MVKVVIALVQFCKSILPENGVVRLSYWIESLA